MSTVEEQLIQDIAAVTGRVVVSERDLRDARKAIDERLDARDRRNRRLTLGVVAAVVAVAVVGIVGYEAFRSMSDDEGSAPPVSSTPSTAADPDASFLTGAAPTPELLNGVWRVDNDTLLVRFSVYDRSPDEVYFDNGGDLYSDPRVQGTFAINGDLIVVTVTGGRAGCAGQTFSMRASLPSDGAMRFVHSQPGTGNCNPGKGERWVLEQVLPIGPALAGLSFAGESGWEPADDSSDLFGVWMAEGGKYVLELGRSGNYYVADNSGEPVDRGEWSHQGAELTLTSSSASSQCSAGDSLVLQDLELIIGDATGMHGTVAQNACGGSWATKWWIRLPDSGSG